MLNITINADWVDAKNKCRTTTNKIATGNYPSDVFKYNLLISEHSPIRILRVSWHWDSIKYWLSTEFSRHHIGWEKWISTQRDDRVHIDRNKKPQDSIVMMDVEANCQSLINVARFRLCNCAHPEARKYMEELKIEIHKYDTNISDVMQKNCVYRCGCPEFSSCGWWENFVSTHKNINLTCIKDRYKIVNDEFYSGVVDGK